MMAASASGLSITRLEPNLRCRSSVTRNTPPSTPTSSPMTTMSSSRSISWSSARLRALTRFSLAMRLPSARALTAHRGGGGIVGGLGRGAGAVLQSGRQLGTLGLEVRRARGVGVLEHAERIGRAQRLEALHRGGDLRVDRLGQSVVQKLLLLQVGAEARERVLLLPRLHFLGRAVLGRVVGGGVHAEAIGHALDQRGAVARARAVNRLLAGRVDGQDVVAVHL